MYVSFFVTEMLCTCTNVGVHVFVNLSFFQAIFPTIFLNVFLPFSAMAATSTERRQLHFGFRETYCDTCTLKVHATCVAARLLFEI